jgi:hypothetical protein
MKKLLGLAVAGIMVTGCALQWRYPPSQEAQYQKDRKECFYEAQISVPSNGDAFRVGLERRKLTEMCMEIRGYEKL